MSGQLIIEFVGQNRQTRGKIFKAKNIGIIGHPSDIMWEQKKSFEILRCNTFSLNCLQTSEEGR